MPALRPAEGVADLTEYVALAAALALVLVLADAGGRVAGRSPVPVAVIATLLLVPALGGTAGRPVCVRNGIIA